MPRGACDMCGEPFGPEGFVWGYGYAEDDDGERLKDSEVTVGLFHRTGWESWQAEHGEPES